MELSTNMFHDDDELESGWHMSRVGVDVRFKAKTGQDRPSQAKTV